MEDQEPPFAVQVELTEGCNLRCGFCGINGIRTEKREYSFMSLETAEMVAAHLNSNEWTARIEFAMHGEPSLNPNLLDIVRIFRTALPKNSLMITSNGAGFVKDTLERFKALYEAGINTIALDEYHHAPMLVPRIREAVIESLSENYLQLSVFNIGVYEYPRDKDGNPHQRTRKKRLVFIAPIDTATEGTHSTLNNHAGCAAPRNNAANGRRCAKPFREMSVRWDGSVAVCCNDWRGELPIGNLMTMTLDDVWNSLVMKSARRYLYHGRRELGPCLGCDAVSYRTGLLPDKMGREDLAEPSEADEMIIKLAMGKGPLTLPVLRDWEK